MEHGEVMEWVQRRVGLQGFKQSDIRYRLLPGNGITWLFEDVLWRDELTSPGNEGESAESLFFV